MPLSPDPLFSTPPEDSDSLKHSRYAYRHLQALRQGWSASPLRVIAHIDLDAFYAQCEMVRLGTSRSAPLAVQQWESLIAINYPARSFGITRMLSAKEARKLCPEIVLQHVATFREGEGGRWAYRDDAFRNIGSDKVSLDPYRAESLKILAVMKDELGGWHNDLVNDEQVQAQVLVAGIEKASVDEAFIDLSPLVFGVLLQRYPELRAAPQGTDDKTAMLPSPPTTALQWDPEDCLVDLDHNETEVDSPDWDDIIMLIGSEIVRSVRKAIRERHSYTCSAGIARNKMMAKLGSSTNKPNKQTIVRNRAVQNFLGGFKFTKIRMLGGKLGDQVAAFFGTEQVSDLLQVSIDQFRAKLDDDTATWLYGIIRGEDRSEVNPRTQIKSMLSAKSFRPSINSADQADRWLRIFAADLANRLAEDESKRRPKIIALHHRQGAQVRSRQNPIPGSKPVGEPLLFELGTVLLRQVIADGNVWPCSNLSLSVGAFEESVAKNRAIDSFVVRGEQARSIHHSSARESDTEDVLQQPDEKRRKVEDDGIRRFFSKPSVPSSHLEPARGQDDPTHAPEQYTEDSNDALQSHFLSLADTNETQPEGSYLCTRCNRLLPDEAGIEHDDWHFAKDLEYQEREAIAGSSSSPNRPSRPSSVRNRAGRNGRGKPERGQMRLRFG
ncbi:Sister chromatid cohesion protein [Aspergillus sp. HF37]|nr:Sister chromatid cohesion protein [Aspergillus sp. HF37]